MPHKKSYTANISTFAMDSTSNIHVEECIYHKEKWTLFLFQLENIYDDKMSVPIYLLLYHNTCNQYKVT